MTKVGIMQPYFAPYLGYVSLMKHTNEFILFDTVQFIRHGWIERNRILKQNDGWLYIQVPLEKHSRETLIKDVKINNETDWKKKILSQLVIYKKAAPNYYQVIRLLNEVFEKEYTSIVQLNKILLEKICTYLGFPKTLPIFSEMNIEIEEAKMPDEWALNICKKLGNDITYINPIGGLDFFDKQKYTNNNIQIFFQKMSLEPYNQRRDTFEAGLSIIDVMLFNSVEEINIMLDKFELL
jgi:hypothetical protein